MGVSVHYWAIPPSSTLFRRLQREKSFATLMAALFPYGRGIFYFFDGVDPEEVEEILEEVIESRRDALGSDREARLLIDEFRQELDRTRLAHAGVEHRRTSLEKTSQLLQERLVQKLMNNDDAEATRFIREMMYGDQELGRDLGLLDGEILAVVSAPLVRESAATLNRLDAANLFARDGGWEEYHLESFKHWRQLFQEAAANAEVLLVGVC